MFESFHYKTLRELQKKAESLQAYLPLCENTDVLSKPIAVGKHTLPNRIAIQPMEGCDGTKEGRPGELTCRRYRRFAAGGAGLIWFEATAVMEEARANPRQLMINEENLGALQKLVSDIKETAIKEAGSEPLLICQLTHSGRYAKPHGIPAPLVMGHHPLFEKEKPLTGGRILSDEELKQTEEAFGRAARLAQKAGFDGADIKCCHGYLLNESLSAFQRPGPYGGSFQNRTRLYRNAVKSGLAAVSGDFLITSRLGVYDGFPYPFGFGADESGRICWEEPLTLIHMLTQELGLPMLDITMGNPYQNPHVNRPYNQGPYLPEEHPLEGVGRMMKGFRKIKEAYPHTLLVGSGYSYLREFSPYLAAGSIESGAVDVAGFGRMAFAYPDFPKAMLAGGLDRNKVCIGCGKCSQLMRGGRVAGCPVRDGEAYLSLYREMKGEK